MTTATVKCVSHIGEGAMIVLHVPDNADEPTVLDLARKWFTEYGTYLDSHNPTVTIHPSTLAA